MIVLSRRICIATLGLITTVLLSNSPTPAADDDGFTALFNGRDFGGWRAKVQGGGDPEDTWHIEQEVIICSGKPNGFGYTERSFKNYVLRYDWRFKRPDNLSDDAAFDGNSGCLVHVQKPDTPAVAGLWPQSVEIQGMNRDHGKLIFINCKKLEDNYDRAARDRAIKPVGEWNTTEVTCLADGTVIVKLNGTEVARGKSDLTQGQIAFQSEGAEIHYRNIKIKELK